MKVQSWRSAVRCAILALVLCAQLFGAARTEAATPQEVDQALEKAAKWLWSQQNHDGTWEPTAENTAQWDVRGRTTGMTALATLALLSSGASAQDERLKPAIDFLTKTPTDYVYALGLRTQLWNLLPQTPAVMQARRRDVEQLQRGIVTTGKGAGLYDYYTTPGKTDALKTGAHHSTANFGVLGAWAAAEGGAEFSDKFWKLIDSGWRATQEPDGSWAYKHGEGGDRGKPSPTMTGAAIATLLITQDYLRRGDLACRGNPTDPALDRAMLWLDANYKFGDVYQHGADVSFYALYNIERIGAAGGFRTINGVDWYQVGADYALSKQRDDGAWSAMPTANAVPDTAMAMLFLAHGREPIAFSKLSYSLKPSATARQRAPTRRVAEQTTDADSATEHGRWNQRPRDVARVSRWVGQQMERYLNWQIVTLDLPVEQLLETGVLYISGDQPLIFDEQQQQKLRAYLEAGGLVLLSADCADRKFADSVLKLGTELFPTFEFRVLPQDHVLYSNGMFPRPKGPAQNVLALSNGAREMMLLVPQADLGRAWQAGFIPRHEPQFALAANLLMYATREGGLRRRGETFAVVPDSQAATTRTLRVARLQYAGNWDPEPGGWRRLDAILRNTAQTALEVQPIEITTDALTPSEFPLAHLTGTHLMKFNQAQQDALKRYIEQGGTLLIDAAGGASAFTTGAEELLQAMFPESAAQLNDPLPPDHPLFRNGGVERARWRSYARNLVGGSDQPRLRALQIDGRIAVIFSREDLSVGLVGSPVDGIIGYEPASAVQLVRAILDFVAAR